MHIDTSSNQLHTEDKMTARTKNSDFKEFELTCVHSTEFILDIELLASV